MCRTFCCCQQPKTNRNNNYDPDIKSDIYLVPKNVLRNAMWKPRTGSSSVPVTNVKMLDNDNPCLLPPEKKLQHTFIFAANIVHRQTLVG